MMRNYFLIALFLFVSYAHAQYLPKTSLKDLNGTAIDLLKITNSDSVKVLSFWATWCVPCINELDAISDVYEDWQDETNVEIIAISTDDSRTKKRVRPLVNGKSWTYKILLDENQDLKRALNISILPHVILIKNGKIVHRHSGYTPGNEDELYEIIQKYSN